MAVEARKHARYRAFELPRTEINWFRTTPRRGSPTPACFIDYAFDRGWGAVPAGLCRRAPECFRQNTIAIETEGEHAAQGGAIAHSVCGKPCW